METNSVRTEIPLEHTLSINEFNNPRIYKGKEAISQLLIHLILLEPGTIASRPDMGVGLISKYRYNDEDSLTDLRKDIASQINTYLPEFIGVEVGLELDGEDRLIINITIDNTIYKYETSKQEDNKIRLSELSI